MSATRIVPALACLLLACALPLAHADAATAKNNFMKACGEQWKFAKAHNTVPDTMKWPEFVKEHCSQSASTGEDASATTPDDQDSASQSVTAPVKTSTKTASSSSGGSFMKTCSDSWKKMKAANSVPAGLTWKQFVKQQCAVDGSGSSTTASYAPDTSDDANPPAPDDKTAMKPTADWTRLQVATTDKNGKPFTPGQIAAHQRIKECAAEWHADKDAGTLPSDEKWPQFWSSCNTRLKSSQG